MKYSVDKNKFVKLLNKRPHLINNIEGLTEDVILDLYSSANTNLTTKIYLSIPDELKTLKVTRLYLRQLGSYGFDFSIVPEETKKQFTAADRKKIIREASDSVILLLPDMTINEWIFAFKGSFSSYDEIPKEVWTREMLLSLLSDPCFTACSACDETKFANSVEHLFDQDFANKVAGLNIEALNLIPKRFITNRILKTSLPLAKKDEEFDFEGIPTKGKLEDSVWDSETADLAMKTSSNNISFIPAEYLKSEHKIQAASKGIYSKAILDDYQALVTFLTNEDINPDIRKALASEDPIKVFIDGLKVEDCDPLIFVFNIVSLRKRKALEPEVLIEGLKINPNLIKTINKSEQTDEMVNALVCSASAQQIDDLATYIDRRRIKANQACLLIGCKNSTIVEQIKSILHGRERKMVPDGMVPSKQGTVSVKQVPNGLVINMSPGAFAKIYTKLV